MRAQNAVGIFWQVTGFLCNVLVLAFKIIKSPHCS